MRYWNVELYTVAAMFTGTLTFRAVMARMSRAGECSGSAATFTQRQCGCLARTRGGSVRARFSAIVSCDFLCYTAPRAHDLSLMRIFIFMQLVHMCVVELNHGRNYSFFTRLRFWGVEWKNPTAFFSVFSVRKSHSSTHTPAVICDSLHG